MTNGAPPLHILLQDLEDLCFQIRGVGIRSGSNLLSTRCEGEGHGHWFGNEIISHQLPGKTPLPLLSCHYDTRCPQPPCPIAMMIMYMLSCTYTAIPSQFSHFVPWESKICLHCKTLLFCDGEGYSYFFQQLLATLYAKSGDLSLQQMFSLPTTDCTPVLPHIPQSPAGGPW
jgi:hypothetical protein